MRDKKVLLILKSLFELELKQAQVMMNQNEAMMALMENLKSKNPSKFELLNQIMQQNSQQNITKPKELNSKVQGQLNRLLKINNTLKAREAKLKKQKTALLKHLDFFIALNNEFSKAVGACPCWGLDEGCECKEDAPAISNKTSGGPGTNPVDIELFKVYVLPSLSDELLAKISSSKSRRVPEEV